MSVSAEEFAAALGGPSVLRQAVRSLRDLKAIARNGSLISALDALIVTSKAPHQGRAKNTRPLNKIVPRATHYRAECLNLPTGEITEWLARLYTLAKSACSDGDALARFLTTPHNE